MHLPRIGLLALVCATGVSAGCNRAGCDGQTYVPKASNPVINNMKLVEQWPTDPWTAIFSVSFQDQAADLGQGNALIYLNGNSSPVTVSLSDALEESDLDPNATEGIFAMHLRFAETVQDGDVVRLGTQLQGGGGGKSNCYEMDLDFTVVPVTSSTLLEKTSLWAAHVFDVVRRDLLKTRG